MFQLIFNYQLPNYLSLASCLWHCARPSRQGSSPSKESIWSRRRSEWRHLWSTLPANWPDTLPDEEWASCRTLACSWTHHWCPTSSCRWSWVLSDRYRSMAREVCSARFCKSQRLRLVPRHLFGKRYRNAKSIMKQKWC